jgi:hypothetical protein
LNVRCQQIFVGCFLATQSRLAREARWIAPSQISGAAHWASQAGLRRSLLIQRHEANTDLKRRLLRGHGWIDSGSLILWQRNVKDIPRWLRANLISRVGQKARLMCRADI